MPDQVGAEANRGRLQEISGKGGLKRFIPIERTIGDLDLLAVDVSPHDVAEDRLVFFLNGSLRQLAGGLLDLRADACVRFEGVCQFEQGGLGGLSGFVPVLWGLAPPNRQREG
ncbi:MAG TPA: hypothetical protein PKE62_05370, partial [Anaerolineales bacterium]|nr:hypothetical protein [Anaerolineales bacterium]